MTIRVVVVAASLLFACGKGGDANTKTVGEGDVVGFLKAASPTDRARILAAAGVDSTPAAPAERTDLIARDGAPQTLLGNPPDVGDAAPAFELRADGGEVVRLDDYRGKRLVLSVVPSIDTRVCEAQTHRMTDAEAQLPDGTALLTVSRDLPMAQQRFVEDAQIKTSIASDFKGGGFGSGWGLAVKETGLLARSVWIIDTDGRIAYRELVANQATEPDYDALLAALAGEP
jgi:thiol peroxidase